MTKLLACFSLRTKLWLGLGGLFFILLVGSAISAVVLSHFGHELQRLLRENYDSEVYCNEMIEALDRLDSSARQIAWNEAGPPVDAPAQISHFENSLAKQVRNVSLPGESDETKRLISEWRTFRQGCDLFAKASRSDSPAIYVHSIAPTYQRTRATARRIAAMNMNNVVSADGRVRLRSAEARNVLLVLVGAGAFLAIAVLAAAGTTVLGPLRDLTRSVGRVGAGELDLAVPVQFDDEVGQLALAFNAMAARLREYRRFDHERLLRARNTTQLAIDSLPDAVLVSSPVGVIEIANTSASEHFHAEPGRNVADLGFDWLMALHRDALSGKEAESRGYASAIQLFENGQEKFLLPRGVPMLHAGNVVGVAIVLVDITRLRQADEFKSGLVSTVSHELRTPLTAIRMATIMLADETLGPLTPSQRKLVNAARDESDRLYRIIENLLNFSRSQAGSAKLRPKAVTVVSLIADALSPLAPAFDQKNIRVDISADNTPDAWADPALAASVLGNLLSNALKYSPPGGDIIIAAKASGDAVEITVADNGPGIPPEHANKLFQRFFRAPGENNPPGTGLGLAIAREIAVAHGGTLIYTPRPGGGSIFCFTLPTAPVVISPPESQAS